MKAKKKSIFKSIDPDFIERHKAELIRTNRQVIYFNSKEMEAIEEYCKRYKIKAKSSLFRKAIMETILEQLDQTNPTLF